MATKRKLIYKRCKLKLIFKRCKPSLIYKKGVGSAIIRKKKRNKQFRRTIILLKDYLSFIKEMIIKEAMGRS